MIGIIAAMEEEASILREAIENQNTNQICGIRFFEGHIGSQEVVLCKSGVGKVNSAIATTILIEYYSCAFILNTGIAGGITGVETKDIVIARELSYSDVDTTQFGYAYGQVPGMPKTFMPNLEGIIKVKQILKRLGLNYKEAKVYSADSFVSSLEQVSKVDISKPCIAEMEGASVAQTCVRAGVDFIVLRFVSDIVGKTNQIADYTAFESEMAKRSSTICLEIIKNLE
ncbi:MAG: 5'-methylthioadenosine/adenosylhomocysteine nucleosidase [Anaeroplasmataceae bacterium]|nr:5'-methylthioadenosine/adenosylhomocysteine nucleosidase [Anaeroplasmataceae bacterium]